MQTGDPSRHMLAVLFKLGAKALAQHPLLVQRHIDALCDHEEEQVQQQVLIVEEEQFTQQHGEDPQVHAVPDIPGITNRNVRLQEGRWCLHK